MLALKSTFKVGPTENISSGSVFAVSEIRLPSFAVTSISISSPRKSCE